MTKTMKTLLGVGCVGAVLFGTCALCLVAGAMNDDAPPAVADAPPSSTPPPSASPAAAAGDLDGHYACLTLSIIVGGTAGMNIEWKPAAMPPFDISGARYETASGSGTLEHSGGVVTFTGGPYDGWRGATGADDGRVFVLFHGTEHGTVRTDGARRGDFKCYRQRG